MGRREIGGGFSFDEERHRYFLNDSPVPGLTQTLALTGFVDPSWFTDEARDRGTRTHAACQFLAEGELDWSTVSEDILPRVKAFEEFISTYDPVLIGAEQFAASAAWGFCCRYDFLFEVPAIGGLSIIEVKTGKAGLAAKLQTAGQKVAIEEWTPFKVAKRFGFELSKEGRYKLVPHNDTADRNMILNAVGFVNRRINEGELKI